MLKQRIITALILLPLVIGSVLYLPDLYFAIVFGLFACVGGWEWTRFVCDSNDVKANLLRLLYVFLVFVLLIISWQFVVTNTSITDWVLKVAIAWWLLATVLVIIFPRGAWFRKNFVLTSALGLLILVSTWTAIVALRNHHIAGIEMLLYVMILIAVADTGAYFGGRKWGKRKLAPKVSPGKSWEGVIAGLVCVSIVAFSYAYLLGLHEETWSQVFLFVGISLLTAMFSVVGDLTESLYKREAGIKDSGSILPGHGGVLDRMDSITAASPVFVACLGWFYT